MQDPLIHGTRRVLGGQYTAVLSLQSWTWSDCSLVVVLGLHGAKYSSSIGTVRLQYVTCGNMIGRQHGHDDQLPYL